MLPYSNVILTLIACSAGIYISENSPLMPGPKRVAQCLLMAAAITAIITNLALL